MIIYVTKKMKTPEKIDILYKIWNISNNVIVMSIVDDIYS